jgi:superfamily I DNA/RNA helicase
MRADRDRYTQLILDSGSPKRLILAGPGTGKTFTFKRALEAAEGNGLVITFVRNLVADLATKLVGLAEAKTFHGLAKGLLFHHNVPGLERPPRYYPPLYFLIEEDLTLLHPDAAWTVSDIDRVFQHVDVDSELLPETLALCNQYNAVSFVDSVYRVLVFMTDNPDALPEYSLVVVDEYQDFSFLETELIRLLASKNPVLIAGDDDQALYGFKHASSQYIQELARDASEYTVFELPYCCRCTEVIVDAVNDVIEAASEHGLLAERLDKSFRCFLPDKAEDGEVHPLIVHAHCSVERKGAPYMGRYVAARIREIPEPEIAESHEEGETTVLVIGEGYIVGLVHAVLSQEFSNVQYAKSEPLRVELLDAYRFLADDDECQLGWRIAIRARPFDGYEDAVRSSLQQELPLWTLVPQEYRDAHLQVVSSLRRLWDGERLEDTDEGDALCTALGCGGWDELRERLGMQAGGAEEAEEAPPLVLEEPTILCTTLRGAKGRSAHYVFDLPPGTVPLLMLVQPPFSAYPEARATTAF